MQKDLAALTKYDRYNFFGKRKITLSTGDELATLRNSKSPKLEKSGREDNSRCRVEVEAQGKETPCEKSGDGSGGGQDAEQSSSRRGTAKNSQTNYLDGG